jgi:SAM-dependent methyltransferase
MTSNPALQPQDAALGAIDAPSGRITFLSPSQPVSMEPHWFELATSDHFLIRRRFEVLLRIGKGFLRPEWQFLEVGCGHGLLQRQLQTRAGLTVDGFDLCLPALLRNEAERGQLYYYNIFDFAPAFAERYNVIFLFDVLEHIEDDVGFLKACLFYLKPGGRVIVNVPARMELFSNYDRMIGHVRRYTMQTLRQCGNSAGLSIETATYWGLPLYPVALMRKILLRVANNRSGLGMGFKPPGGALANSALGLLSQLEFIPQRVLGTSITSIFKKSS